MTREHMVEDQRFASTRTDVLTYQSDELTGDVTLAGPLTASLYVSTTGTDSDWVVKLIDVYPEDYPDPDPNPAGVHMGGYQQLIRGEAMRGKFRNSYSKPEPFVPGKMEKVEWAMPDINHCFRRATGSWCRCRAPGSRWWTATRRSSRISTTPRPRTS
jgi:predicted acyl esterase